MANYANRGERKLISEYDLLMCSVAFAISDLNRVNQRIIELSKDNENYTSIFYFKVNMGFVREAYCSC